MNEETSHMDASMVYGSTLDEQRNLRVGKMGRMKCYSCGIKFHIYM